MEPTLPNPEATGNQPAPNNSEAGSYASNIVEASSDIANEKIGEQVKQLQTVPSDDPRATQQVSPDPQQAVAQATTPLNDNTNPALADDVDVIEKEWVEKAKKIVNSTKENPHEQEKEVSKLQADYLMKRYGKQIKPTE